MSSGPGPASIDDGEADGDRSDAMLGRCVGRYTVRRRIGRGGMGEVFAAHDPELDRIVALKMLKRGVGGGSPEARARFQREAQAMARLNHPNVISVFDVGTLGEDVFVAMELVTGPTLSAWLAEKQRGWREVLDVFLQAGRGLEAAHAAGIVHRDFKPSNVILGDRVRVVDFGLARAPYEPEQGAPPAASTPLEIGVTQTGHHLGTPAYMAPEQIAGRPVDARADQFAFCVALFEGLYGVRPFEGETVAERVEHVARGAPARPPTGSHVPESIHRLIARGLHADPGERHPSMTALLDALEAEVAPRPRAARIALALVLPAVAAAAIALVAWPRGAGGDPCAGASERLAGVWDPARREVVRRAFEGTRLPYAKPVFDQVASLLDRYTSDWTSMQEETCRATHVDRRQSESLFDLRMACLERARSTLAALLDVWSSDVNGEVIQGAISAAASLPPLDGCADAPALAEAMPLPSDAGAAARVHRVRERLDRVRALRDAKRLREARLEAEAARREAEATGFAPVQAEAAYLLGAVVATFPEPGATESLEEALRLASLAHDDRLAADAVIELVAALAATNQGRQAVAIAGVATAVVARAGDRPAQQAGLMMARGQALHTLGKYAEARAALDRARTLFEESVGPRDVRTLQATLLLMSVADAQGEFAAAKQLGDGLLVAYLEVFGPDHPETSELFRALGLLARHSGDYDAARSHYERGLAIADRAFGPDNLRSAAIINGLGVVEGTRGNLGEAKRLYERVLEIRRRLVAPDHPSIAHALANLGTIETSLGHHERALELVREALEINTRAFGPEALDVAFDLYTIAEALERKGDLAESREHFERARDMWRRLVGPEHPSTLHANLGLAQFLARRGECAEALRLAVPAIAGMERVVGPSYPGLAGALATAGRCDVDGGAAAIAIERLERALEIYGRSRTDPVERAAARFDLARARVAAGADRAAAQELARESERELAQAGAEGELELRRVRSWLAGQRRLKSP